MRGPWVLLLAEVEDRVPAAEPSPALRRSPEQRLGKSPPLCERPRRTGEQRPSPSTSASEGWLHPAAANAPASSVGWISSARRPSQPTNAATTLAADVDPARPPRSRRRLSAASRSHRRREHPHRSPNMIPPIRPTGAPADADDLRRMAPAQSARTAPSAARWRALMPTGRSGPRSSRADVGEHQSAQRDPSIQPARRPRRLLDLSPRYVVGRGTRVPLARAVRLQHGVLAGQRDRQALPRTPSSDAADRRPDRLTAAGPEVGSAACAPSPPPDGNHHLWAGHRGDAQGRQFRRRSHRHLSALHARARADLRDLHQPHAVDVAVADTGLPQLIQGRTLSGDPGPSWP